MNGRPAVSVVVVNWNGGDHLGRMLASLEAHPPSGPWEAVVVDNGSTDGSAGRAVTAHPWARLVANATNRGLAAGNNQGLAATAAPLVLLANPDVELTPGAMDALAACMERHPRAGFVVPRLVSPDGRAQTSAGDLPRLREALAGRRWAGGYWRDDWAHRSEERIGRGAEACWLVRRRMVQEVGGQDERYRLDWEGVDWTERARRAGWETWLAPEAVVVHTGGVSISQARLRWVVESHRGMYRYFADRGRPAARPLLAAAVAARGLVKGAAELAGLPTYRWAQRGPR